MRARVFALYEWQDNCEGRKEGRREKGANTQTISALLQDRVNFPMYAIKAGLIGAESHYSRANELLFIPLFPPLVRPF